VATGNFIPIADKAGAPVSASAFLPVSARRLAHLLALLSLQLALISCTTRTLATGGQPALTGTASAITSHGYADGELLLRFTPEGERAVAPVVGKPPGRLHFGIPSLDRLNVKYRASTLLTLDGHRGAYCLQLARDANVIRAAEEYGRDPLVSRAEPNYLFRIDRPAEEPETVRTEVP